MAATSRLHLQENTDKLPLLFEPFWPKYMKTVNRNTEILGGSVFKRNSFIFDVFSDGMLGRAFFIRDSYGKNAFSAQ